MGQERATRTLVVGLGNPVLGDDGVGWRVAEALRDRLESGAGAATCQPLDAPTPASTLGRAKHRGGAPRSGGEPIAPPVPEIDCLSLGGLRLMEQLVGYDRVIVVDAMTTGHAGPGTVGWHGVTAGNATADSTFAHTGSAHDTSLQTALALGRSLGADLPSEVLLLGIETQPSFEFGEDLTPEVEAAVPVAVDLLLDQLERWPSGRAGQGTATRGASALERRTGGTQAEGTGVGLLNRSPRGGIDG